MSIDIDLAGCTTIVTGGGRGIGEVIADVFARAGSDVVVAARTESEIRETVEAITDHGIEARAIPADVSKPDDAERLIEQTTDELGVPDVLINNAGLNIAEPLADQSMADVRTMNEVNLEALFALSKAFAETFESAANESHGRIINTNESHGRIINISSVYGRVGVHGKAAYSATKAGVYGITRSLAVELAPLGITVNSVSPGRIRIERVEEVMERDDFRTDLIPLGRLGEPEDVAYCCLFLASGFAQYVTGTDLCVDGGVHVTSSAYDVGE